MRISLNLATLALIPGVLLADPLAGLDAQLTRMMSDWNVPGAAVGVVHDGRLVYARGFGVRELGKPDPVDADTLFYAGSTSKAVTALAAGLLVQEGKLAWDAPLAGLVPGLEFADARATAEITLRDALSHRTGYATGYGGLLYTGSRYTPAEAIRLLRHEPRPLPHRAEFGYHNLMYAAVGEAVAARAGNSFDAFLRERIWEPLGMTRTFTRRDDYLAQPNVFTPHRASGGSLRIAPHLSLETTGGAGFVITSVNDYAKWIARLLAGGDDLFREETLRAVWSPVLAIGDRARAAGFMPETATYSYGLGWFVGDFRGTPAKFHRGNWVGGMAAVGLLPEKRLGVVVFENRDGHSFVNAVVYALFERFVPGSEPVDFSEYFLSRARSAATAAPPARATPAFVHPRTPAYSLSAYAGRYVSAAYGGEARLEVVGGELRLTLSAHPGLTGTLRPLQGEVFTSEWEPALLTGTRLRFVADAHGRVVGLDLSPNLERGVYSFHRQP